MSQDPALQVGTEVPFDPEGNTVTDGGVILGLCEKGLEVVLDDGIEGRSRRLAGAVDVAEG